MKEESGSGLKEKNDQLKLRIAELQGIIKSQGAETERLQARNANLEKIRETLALPGDVINRALLFDEDIKKEGQLIRSEDPYHTWSSMATRWRRPWGRCGSWLLFPGPVEIGSSQPASQATTPPPQQSEAPVPTLEELEEESHMSGIFQEATQEVIATH